MSLQKNMKNWGYLSMHVLLFAMPFYQVAVPPLIIVFSLISLFSVSWKDRVSLFKSRWKVILLFSSPYLLLLIGFWNTENFVYAFKDLEIKLSLLLFPLIILTTDIFSKSNLVPLLRSFVIGCSLSTAILFTHALFYYYKTGDVAFFYYKEFSIFHHPSYMAMFMNFALATLIIFIFNLGDRIRVIYFVLLSMFIIAIYQLSSKAGIIVLVILLMMTFIYLLAPRVKWYNTIIAMVLAVSFSGIVVYNSSFLKSRFSEMTESIQDNSGSSTSAVRLKMWGISLEIVKAHPVFGVGSGDVQDQLQAHYKRDQVQRAIDENLNPHNQFLQTSIANGVVGGLSILAILLFQIYYAWKQRILILGAFACVNGFNFLFESMLERQSGVVFFALVNCLLFFTIEVKRTLNIE